MAILTTDIQFRLSGGASNSLPTTSLGGAKSSASFGATVFANVGGAEAAAGSVKYRCGYAHNAHASLPLSSAVAWMNSNTPSTSTIIEIGVGTAAMNGTEQTIADENTAPVGVTFYPAASKAAGVALGDIPAGQSRSYWERRTVSAGASVTASDPFTVRVEGETAA